MGEHKRGAVCVLRGVSCLWFVVHCDLQPGNNSNIRLHCATKSQWREARRLEEERGHGHVACRGLAMVMM
jgi:hypothetical protein